jgi:hypothetical protein
VRSIRVFVSSPGDAMDERKRVVRVIERLNAAFAGVVAIEPVLWEERFYSAHEGFQPQIARSAECDVVVAILRARLGTPLPPEFPSRLPQEERLSGGRTYPSGTAYEILSAIDARRRGADLPDIFVFRYPLAPSVPLDAPDRVEIEAQWAKLKSFAEQVFVSAEGQFMGAYQTFSSTDDFEAKVEGALRQWLSENVLKGRVLVWPVATKGSPFRGLEPFGAKHADVFFGRDGDRTLALDQLKDAAEAGFPLLLIVGPSGAGKSSFARAGLLPWLTKPGAVTGVGVWRAAVMRPSDHPEGALASLASHLFDGSADIPEPETGRPIALPELASGDSPTAEALAGLFRVFAHGRFERPQDDEEAGRAATAPIEKALKSVAEADRKSWNSERESPARLLLIVDQLDELFAAGVDEAARVAFARLLDRLARTGLAWIVATLRAEYYEEFLKGPLARLASAQNKENAAQLDSTFNLLAPGLAEMAEVVRGPARAAGLEWETDKDSGERLDDRLLKDIDRPDLLPLVQFVLDRLYEQRITKDDGAVLTFYAYRKLGTLDGAIDTAAERALSALGPTERGALPRLLRTLVAYAASTAAGGKGAAAPRQTPRAAAAHDQASKRLVDALIEARILVSGRDQQNVPTVALAHQRIIEAWGHAKEIVHESERLLRIRDEVETSRRKWEGAGLSGDFLLGKGLPLAEAEDIVKKLGEEIPAESRDFIKKSRARADRAQIFNWMATAGFALLAIGAFGAAYVANQNLAAAKAAREDVRDVAQLARNELTNSNKTLRDRLDDLLDWTPPAWRGALYHWRASAYASAGDYLAQRRDLDKALRVEPDLVPLLTTSSDNFVVIGNADGAVRDAKKALGAGATDAVIYGNLILGEAMQRDYAGAIAHIEEALQKSQRTIQSTESLSLPDLQAIIGGLRLKVRDTDFLLALRYQKAALYAMNGDGRFADALAEADRSDRDHPFSRTAYLAALNWEWLIVRGQAMRDAREAEAGAATSSPEPRLPIKDYGAYAIEGALWARIAATRGEFADRAERAFDNFREAHKAAANDKYRGLATWVERQPGKPVQKAEPDSPLGEARDLEVRAIELGNGPNSGTAPYRMAPALGLLSDAIHLLDPQRLGRPLGRREEDLLIDLLLKRGDWKLSGKDSGGAAHDARRVLDIDPRIANAHRLLGDALAVSADRRREYKEALDLDAGDKDALSGLASIEGSTPSEALDLLDRRRRFIRLRSENYSKLASLQDNVGLARDALDNIGKAIELVPWEFAYYSARRDYEIHAKIDRDLAYLHYARGLDELAEFSTRTGDDDSALRAYAEAFRTVAAVPEGPDAARELGNLTKRFSAFLVTRFGRADAEQWWRSFAVNPLASKREKQLATGEAQRVRAEK